MSAPAVVIYGTRWCADSTRAQRLLEARGIPYRFVDIDADAEGAAYVMQVNQGHRSAPTIVFPDGSILVEPTRSQLTRKLDSLAFGS